MKLYEFAPTRLIRARWTLQELGLDFDAITVDMRTGAHKKPEYLKINPAGKLPALVDGDFVLTESIAIVLYPAEKVPQKRLLPADLKQRAELHRWLMFAVTELEQPLWRMARNTLIYPEEQRQPADIAIARREFQEMVAIVERHMKDRQFVVGDHVTVGDIVLAYTLDWGNENDLLGACPQLRAYVERMYARPNAAPRIRDALASLPPL